jgi:hypothetical protein
MEMNGDQNSGDPTGFGLSPMTWHNGLRVTASTAYLSSRPDNLTVVTGAQVARILFDSDIVVGVETISGQTYKASKEVIIAAGIFDSPKLLLLSGVGSSSELDALSIPVVKTIPGVGKNLKDHSLALVTSLVKTEAQLDLPSVSDIPAVAASNHMAARDSVSESLDPSRLAWVSSPAVKTSSEIKEMEPKTRLFLEKVPSFELFLTRYPWSLDSLLSTPMIEYSPSSRSHELSVIWLCHTLIIRSQAAAAD